MAWVLSGSVNMLAMLAVPDTVPRSTNAGLRPREERRTMILMCCGRYETSMPITRKLFAFKVSYARSSLGERQLTQRRQS
jgi:hypothetical protein